jgi:hypothetical protein
MPLRLIEGEPSDRRIVVEQGRQAIHAVQNSSLALSQNEREALVRLQTTLGKLNIRENGLVCVTADVMPYIDATSLTGEDPLLAAYSIFEDPDPEKGEFDKNILLIEVSNPRYIYESQIGAILEDPQRRGSKKEERLRTVYSGSGQENRSTRPSVKVALMKPGVDYSLKGPHLAGVGWEVDKRHNKIITVISIGERSDELKDDSDRGMTASTFTRMRNDAIWRTNLAKEHLR